MTSYQACPSEQLLATTVRLWNATQHYRRAFMLLAGADRMPLVNAEHQLLLDAVRRRDTEDAEQFLAAHIRRTRGGAGRPPRALRHARVEPLSH